MSASHHGDPEIMRRFLDQIDQTAKREYPQGRMGAEDQGSLAYALATDQHRRVIVLSFGKPVEWIGLGVEEATQLRDALTERILSLRGISQ